MSTLRILSLAVAILLAPAAAALAAPDLTPLDTWLGRQENVTSLKADFTQTRKLKTFNKPLVSEGTLSFSEPENFRWEISKPSPSIAIFGPEEVVVMYPKLKRAELMKMVDIAKTKYSDTFELIKSGFPRSRKELERLFNIEGLEKKGEVYELRLSLKRRGSDNPVKEARVYFTPEQAGITATELELADGSTIRNDFKNMDINAKIAKNDFDQAVPSGFAVSEPLK